MKKASLLLVLALLLTGCGPAAGRGEVISSCASTLSNLVDFQAGTSFPSYFESENPVKQGGELDVMDYFTVFDHLSMSPGFVLDYVYHFDGMGGYPLLYARPEGQPAYASEADLPESVLQGDYMDFVATDDTPEGYFQFAAMNALAGQFYLFWHSNYNDTEILCNRTDVQAITSQDNFGISLPLGVKLRAALLHDLAPRVVLTDDTARVQMVTFTKWGGFYLETYTISRTLPHQILNSDAKNLIQYDCGIMF